MTLQRAASLFLLVSALFPISSALAADGNAMANRPAVGIQETPGTQVPGSTGTRTTGPTGTDNAGNPAPAAGAVSPPATASRPAPSAPTGQTFGQSSGNSSPNVIGVGPMGSMSPENSGAIGVGPAGSVQSGRAPSSSAQTPERQR